MHPGFVPVKECQVDFWQAIRRCGGRVPAMLASRKCDYCSRSRLEIFSLGKSFCEELTQLRIQFSRHTLSLAQESMSILPTVVHTPILMLINDLAERAIFAGDVKLIAPRR